MSKRRELTKKEKEMACKLKVIFDGKKDELNLTQLSAAYAMGWKSQGAVYQFLNGRVPLNTDAKIKFANLLGVSVSDFDSEFNDIVTGTGKVNAESATANADNLSYDTRLAIKFLSNPPDNMRDVAVKMAKLVNSVSDINSVYNAKISILNESLKDAQK